ncbi:hypothetical protein K502DRAFT_353852 [Neoconidiobolus thromboides FSU 785]|nr:hypothetical protein K502DRAFT_353852 [Neoconidiobolus thromboides FSU 785]
MQTFITKLRNGFFGNFNTTGRSTQYKHWFMGFYNKRKLTKDILSKFTIDNNKLNQPMCKINALTETGNKNQQVALLSTIASVYSFDECKSFGFNRNRNQYDYSKISNNNKISAL